MSINIQHLIIAGDIFIWIQMVQQNAKSLKKKGFKIDLSIVVMSDDR